MYQTIAEKQVSEALRKFWLEHYKKRHSYTSDKRNELAETFITEHIGEYPFFKGINPTTPFLYHPAIYGSVNAVKANIYDILADFIVASDNIAENKAEYPTKSQRYNFDARQEQLRNEIAIHDNEDSDASQPPHTVKMEKVDVAPVFYPLDEIITEDDLQKMISRIKADPKRWAIDLAKFYGYSREEAAEGIKRMKLENVKTCEVCHNAYHAKDKRQKVCELRKYYKTSYNDGQIIYLLTEKSRCQQKINREKVSKSRAK